MPQPEHKVIITGTGRAGTTFIVQLLTGLGLDTGYTAGKWGEDYFEHCSAGLERGVFDEGSPYIVKNPNFCDTLPSILAAGFVIDHALVAIRDLDEVARSRIQVGGGGADAVPGGLWGTADPERQKAVLAEKFHGLIHTLAVHDIPHTLLHFPRIARDPDYAYAKLSFLARGTTREAFTQVFRETARPELIHAYGAGGPQAARAPTMRYLDERRRKRRRRAAKRVVIAAAIAAAAIGAVRLISSRNPGPAATHAEP